MTRQQSFQERLGLAEIRNAHDDYDWARGLLESIDLDMWLTYDDDYFGDDSLVVYLYESPQLKVSFWEGSRFRLGKQWFGKRSFRHA